MISQDHNWSGQYGEQQWAQLQPDVRAQINPFPGATPNDAPIWSCILTSDHGTLLTFKYGFKRARDAKQYAREVAPQFTRHGSKSYAPAA